jgi:hypothetical protein
VLDSVRADSLNIKTARINLIVRMNQFRADDHF